MPDIKRTKNRIQKLGFDIACDFPDFKPAPKIMNNNKGPAKVINKGINISGLV